MSTLETRQELIEYIGNFFGFVTHLPEGITSTLRLGLIPLPVVDVQDLKE